MNLGFPCVVPELHKRTKNRLQTSSFIEQQQDDKLEGNKYLREREVMVFPVSTGALSPSATLLIKGSTSLCTHSGMQDL
jgi:hypothetical protein